MRPSQVRDRILSDHVALRGILADLESLARDVLGGEYRMAGALRFEGEGLLEELSRHMSWEERHLIPALQDADAWGEADACVDRLHEDHAEQRALLSHALERLRDPSRPAALVARNLLDLAAVIRQDMEDEERFALSERVLRDDVIAIDAETG